jgi:hypothetical protein
LPPSSDERSVSSGTTSDGSPADRLADVAWPGVVVSGVGAFLAGYVLTILVVVLGPSSTAGGIWGVLVLLAFVFYGAHNVSIDAGDVGQVNMIEEAARGGTSVPVVVFYAVPILVLLVTAVLVTTRFIDRQDPVQSMGAVFGIAGGYALVAAAGTFVFTSNTIFGDSARPVLSEAVAFGLVYPVVFGTIGAALVGVATVVREGT